CLVCKDQMRRKSDRQRFGSGHRTCQSEYRRFPHVYELPSRSGYQGSQNARKGGRKCPFYGPQNAPQRRSRLLPDRSARLSHQRHRRLQIPAGTSMPGWRAMKETSREHRPYRRASDAPLEQAMRDIRAEQKLRPEEAGRLNVVSEKQLAIGTVAQVARMSKKPLHDLLTAALQYAALGLPVVPVHSINGDGWCSCRDGKSCARPGKHPRTQNGIYDATCDPTEIESFWARWPDANIGI